MPKKGKDRRVVVQDKLGYKYDIIFYNLIEGKIPKFIDIHNPFTLENIDLWLHLNRPDFYLCNDNVYEKSNKNLKFIHSIPACQDEFFMSWDSIYYGQNCSICSGRQVGKRTSLAYLRSDLAAEWHPDNKKRPEEYVCGSNENVYWICPNGHEYLARINHRTFMNSGCRRCSDEQKESVIATGLKMWCEVNLANYNKEYRIIKNPKTGNWLWYDIYIGKRGSIHGCYIEIHGWQHYKLNPKYHKTQQDFKDSKYRDNIKRDFANENGHYIEVDLRKIKTVEEAVEYVKSILEVFGHE